jgi:hypothetical protein
MNPHLRCAAGLSVLLAACLLPAFGADELWKDPGVIETLDLAAGPGGKDGAPKPPFQFVKEDLAGSSPKVFVRDASERLWNVKFGVEVQSEVFSSRIPWAMGYFSEPTYFVPQGAVVGVEDLSKRAVAHFKKGGQFTNARFQLRDPDLTFLKDHDWSWTNNPFVNTSQLAGLKILIMLTSNWDSKDARDVDEGTNTAIFERKDSPESKHIYAFTDWGQTMGHWGNALRRSEWNCSHFAMDTPQFVRASKQGGVEFGWAGRHTDEFQKGVRIEDVRWMLQYLRRLSDAQIRDALRASGATPENEECFARELRRRIDMLEVVAR